MSKKKSSDSLPLAKALLAWCDPALIDALQKAEQRYIPHELNQFYRATGGIRIRLLPDAEVRVPGSGLVGGPSPEWLIAAWNAVEADFRQRLTTEIHLTGVQVAPSPETEPTSIPQAWASDAALDLTRSTLEFAGRRYAAVTASKERPTDFASDHRQRSGAKLRTKRQTVADIDALDDDTLLAILEAHARRVINSPDAKLIAPGKISLMPIVRRKMVARADTGDLMTSLAAESRFLARWIAEKVQHYSTPSEGTIRKVLGKDYEFEKARSNGAFQKGGSLNRGSGSR
jgi:hypothetical protein